MYICRQISNLWISVDGNFIVLVSQAFTSESSWTFSSLTTLPYLVHQQVCQLFCPNGSRPFLTTSITTILFQGTIHAQDYLRSTISLFTARNILLKHHLVPVFLLPKSSSETIFTMAYRVLQDLSALPHPAVSRHLSPCSSSNHCPASRSAPRHGLFSHPGLLFAEADRIRNLIPHFV